MSWKRDSLKGSMAEKGMLYEIDDGGALVLLDGKHFAVNPRDTSVVVGWSTSARLTLSKNKKLVFRVAVKNEASGQTIAARPTSWRAPRPMQGRRRRPS
jgi:hypothetical protein